MYSEDVEMVTLPGVAGQFGVYPQHVPLMTQMVPGEIIVRKDGRDIFFATGAGLIEVTGTSVAILTDLAVQPTNRRSQGRRSPAARRSAAERETLRRRSRPHQRVAGSLPGPVARQAAATQMKRPNQSQHTERDLAGALGMPWRLTKEVGGNHLISLQAAVTSVEQCVSAGQAVVYGPQTTHADGPTARHRFTKRPIKGSTPSASCQIGRLYGLLATFRTKWCFTGKTESSKMHRHITASCPVIFFALVSWAPVPA